MVQIQHHSLRESYVTVELSKLSWIPGSSNPADPLTKVTTKEKTPLRQLMTKNIMKINPLGWATVTADKHEQKENTARVNNSLASGFVRL